MRAAVRRVQATAAAVAAVPAAALPCVGGARDDAWLRWASSRAAAAARARDADRIAPTKRFVMKAGEEDPLFRELWRRLQLRVHPDLFARYPDLRARNEASLKKLQGCLLYTSPSPRD